MKKNHKKNSRGFYQKAFASFELGILELISCIESVRQILGIKNGRVVTQEEVGYQTVCRKLSRHVIRSINYPPCPKIIMDDQLLEYKTCGGLRLKVLRINSEEWIFYLTHPEGIIKDGTLRDTLTDLGGWTEKYEKKEKRKRFS